MGAKIYNSNLTKAIIDGAKLQQSQGGIPSEIAEKVVPVMEVNPNLLRIAKAFNTSSLSNATSVNSFTASSIKDTYITGLQFSYIKDVTSTATSLAANIVPDGASTAVQVLKITGITLTPQSGEGTIMFNPPFKMKKSTTMTLTSDTNVANVKLTVALFGYEIDNTEA